MDRRCRWLARRGPAGIEVGFIASLAGYVIGTVVMLTFFRSSRQNLALMLSYLFTVIGLSLVNLLHYKASGHGAGIAGPATALTILYGWPGALTFLLLLVVGKAKVSIKEHSLRRCAWAQA